MRLCATYADYQSPTHSTFEDYCRERWAMRREVADRHVRSAAVVAAVNPTGLPVPANEAQARELAPLLDEPATLRETWAEVVELHPEPTTARCAETVMRA